MSKVFVSEKQIIKIAEFIKNYIGIEYEWDGKITHRQMELFLYEKKISVPRRVNFDLVNKESILIGDYVVVKDETSRIFIYENPRKYSLDNLLTQLTTKENLKNIRKARKQILTNLGYKEAINGVVEIEQDEEYKLEKANRQKQFILFQNNAKRKKHY